MNPAWWAQAARYAGRVAWRSVRRSQTGRAVARTGRRVKGWLFRWFVLLAVAQLLVFVFAYAAKPGGPVGPQPVTCGPGATDSVAGQSVLVVMAKANGNALRRLAGPPPDPADVHAAAQDAAHKVVVTVLALKAAARGQDDPAAVTDYTNASLARHADAAARAEQAALTCQCPGPGGGTDDNDGGGVVAATYRQGSTSAGESAGESSGAQLARRAAAVAGFTGRDLDIAVAVAGAESAYRPGATNSNRNGSTDYGLWQINSVHAAILASGDWTDPYANARMARQVFLDAGSSWRPWTTYNSGAYRAFLPDGSGGGGGTGADPAGSGCDGGGVDPVGSTSGPGPWGGYANGRIPLEAMCRSDFAGSVLLRCDAARALDRLNGAFRARFGTDLAVTDSYRDYDAQVRARAKKGDLAAVPGTSNHGWGLAVDLGSGINSFTTSTHAWMRANAGRYGWYHPTWARADGSKPEPWHWEYGGHVAATDTAADTADGGA